VGTIAYGGSSRGESVLAIEHGLGPFEIDSDSGFRILRTYDLRFSPGSLEVDFAPTVSRDRGITIGADNDLYLERFYDGVGARYSFDDGRHVEWVGDALLRDYPTEVLGYWPHDIMCGAE